VPSSGSLTGRGAASAADHCSRIREGLGGSWSTCRRRSGVQLSKSAYHKALRLSYPERKDVDCAKTQNRQPGGDIMIHGLPNGRGFVGAVHHLKNWTQGCIAVRNDEIDYLFNVIRVGTVVEIIP
jgi:murein L,D-transpeptidase YafK